MLFAKKRSSFASSLGMYLGRDKMDPDHRSECLSLFYAVNIYDWLNCWVHGTISPCTYLTVAWHARTELHHVAGHMVFLFSCSAAKLHMLRLITCCTAACTEKLG